MQIDSPKDKGCRNCSRIAHHIRTWTFQTTLKGDDSFWYEEDVGPWQDFIDAQDCLDCTKLVRLLARSDFVPGSTGADVINFSGDMKYNSFELRRVTQGYAISSLSLVPAGPYGHLTGERPVKSDVSDDHFDVEQLQGWISYCDHHHHGHCHNIDANNFFQFPDTIILIDLESNKLALCNQKQRYSALSYVWGQSNEAFATLRSNFGDLSKDGGLLEYWDRLPATLKDAMVLTKSLGIPYLWVDRLCILQDDVDSKQHNISWMASIYANSYLAIIATEGTGANHGIRGVGSDSGPRKGIMKVNFAGIRCIRRMEPEKSKVWHTRGWTFQERTLARRSLVFHGTTVHWECEKIQMEENIHTPKLPSQYSQRFAYQFDLKRWPDFERYATLCHRFSQRALTYEEDVTDAFSSTTNALSRGFPGGFLYAMPKLHFSLSLLWVHREPAKRRPWLPSWSWIGWNGVPSMSIAAACDPEVWDMAKEQRLRERYCCPMARWRIRNSRTQELVEIDDQYHSWQKFERDKTENPPEGWTYIEENKNELGGWVHKEVVTDVLRSRFYHPVPIAKPGPIRPDLDHWDTFVDGTVQLASLRFDGPQALLQGVKLRTVSGRPAGVLWLDKDTRETIAAEDECLVIAIIHTVHIRPNEGRDAVASDNGNVSNTHWACLRLEGYVHILWVQWNDGVAYRRGTGRMAWNIWESLDTKLIDIVLG